MMEMEMTTFKTLQLTALQKGSGNPTMARRAKLVGKLEEQRELALNPTFVRVKQKWIKSDNGSELVAHQQRVRPWWRTDAAGQTVMSMYFGARAIEFEKGKAAIVVPTKDKLPEIIETLIAAVRQGELDDPIAQAQKTRSIPKTKKVV